MELASVDYAEECISAIEKAQELQVLGRPWTMTRDKVHAFLRLIEQGNTITAATHISGLSTRTVTRWCADGQDDETESTAQYYFWRAVQVANAKNQHRHVERIDKASEEPRNWMASIIHLSRRHRQDWAENAAPQVVVNNVVEIGAQAKALPNLPTITTQAIHAEHARIGESPTPPSINASGPSINARLSTSTSLQKVEGVSHNGTLSSGPGDGHVE